MTNAVTMKAEWMSGAKAATIDQLRAAIAARVKYMRGQTTEGAVKATAINCLTSLRAETAVAPKKNPAIIDARWKIDIKATAYKPGWAYPPRKGEESGARKTKSGKTRGGRRVIRMAGGEALDVGPNKNRVVNLAGRYRKQIGESVLKVYAVTICELPNTKPFYNSLIISESKDRLFKFIRKRIVRRIGQYRGISKRLLGIAMHKVAASKGERPQGRLGMLADDYAIVNVSGDGFNRGTYTISFQDNLPFSAQSLKHGPAGVQIALEKAANRSFAIIERAAAWPVDKTPPPTFEEFMARGA